MWCTIETYSWVRCFVWNGSSVVFFIATQQNSIKSTKHPKYEISNRVHHGSTHTNIGTKKPRTEAYRLYNTRPDERRPFGNWRCASCWRIRHFAFGQLRLCVIRISHLWVSCVCVCVRVLACARALTTVSRQRLYSFTSAHMHVWNGGPLRMCMCL